jgi:hypothetical protein
MRKTWQEKLKDKPSLPKVLRLEKNLPVIRRCIIWVPKSVMR